MLEAKDLQAVDYEDIESLDLGIEEGTRLEYKSRFTDDPPKHVCAMANTQGGHILIGVAEEEAAGGEHKLNVPSTNSPGVKHEGKDLRARWRDKIAARTNPRLVLEIRVVRIPGDDTRAVVVIRVEASADAPHQVFTGEDPKILIRRLLSMSWTL